MMHIRYHFRTRTDISASYEEKRWTDVGDLVSTNVDGGSVSCDDTGRSEGQTSVLHTCRSVGDQTLGSMSWLTSVRERVG